MTTGDRIKQLRLALGMSQEELGQKVGVKKAAINKYETGIVVNLKRSVIDKLSTALHTTPAYLMGWDTTTSKPEDEDDELEVFMLGGGSTIHKVKKAPAFSKEKQELIKIVEGMDDSEIADRELQKLLQNYNRLNAQGQREVQKRAEELIEIPRYLKTAETAMIDIYYYDMPVSAGTGVFLSDEYRETIQVKDSYEARNADFALSVSGDSMEPDFHDGDIVFVESRPTVEPGEIGIFVMNGNGYIKKMGRNCLISLNPKYQDIHFGEGDTVVCMGKVIGKQA